MASDNLSEWEYFDLQSPFCHKNHPKSERARRKKKMSKTQLQESCSFYKIVSTPENPYIYFLSPVLDPGVNYYFIKRSFLVLYSKSQTIPPLIHLPGWIKPP